MTSLICLLLRLRFLSLPPLANEYAGSKRQPLAGDKQQARGQLKTAPGQLEVHIRRPGVLTPAQRGPKVDNAVLLAEMAHRRRSEDPRKSLQLLLPLHVDKRLWQAADVRVGVEGVEMAEEVWHLINQISEPDDGGQLRFVSCSLQYLFGGSEEQGKERNVVFFSGTRFLRGLG